MKRQFIFNLLILSTIIFSCATPTKERFKCKDDSECAEGFYCSPKTKKCTEKPQERGNLNQPCNLDNTCNQPYLECKNNTCIIKEEIKKQCQPEDRAACYTGAPETLGKGICKPGYYLCENNYKWNTECQNQVLPQDEICGNGIDDNCNGLTDENCQDDNFCQPYTKKECYSGPEITKNIGICKPGFTVCNEDNKWNNRCNNEILPQEEICGNGFDDNCNGQIDEGCSCKEGSKQICFSGSPQNAGIGVCKTGIQICSGGIWGECRNQILPENEKCDGLDNDCDGIIDEGVTSACNGECQTEPQELCNGKDDNCNGQTDENCSVKCLDYEVCGNFKDDNCNGQIDEGCYDKPQCISNQESCDDIFDNDCNLYVNDGCSCQNGEESQCYSGPKETLNTGECKSGYMYCIGGESWGTCEGEITPISELCNGKDDDCDGQIDENFHIAEKCTVGKGVCQKEGVWVCDKDEVGVICVDTTNGKELHEDKTLASEEICDGIDNDCDGLIDEDFLVGKPCINGYSVCAKTGITICSEDKKSVICDASPDTTQAVEEICGDGIDNDCDGQIDEKTGREICSNGIDDNCDGLVDEQPCLSSGPIVTCPTLDQIYHEGENKIYTLQEYTFTATAYDPNNDELTYKWELISAPEGNGQFPIPDNTLTTKFTPYLVSNTVDTGNTPYILKFTATEKNTEEHLYASCTVEFNVTTKDVFHVELIWSTLSDMDLHLVVPGGNENSFVPRDNNGLDCNYASCRGPVGLEWNGSNSLDNPYLDLDNTVGFGCPGEDNLECNRPENINVPEPRTRTNDIYRVAVYAFRGVGENLKLKILCKGRQEGEFVVKQYQKDRLKSTSTNLNRWWKPANIIWHGNYCTIENN